MLKIKIEKQEIRSILDGNTSVRFSTKNTVTEGMRVAFFCDNGKHKVYAEGVISELLEIENGAQENSYACKIHNDLILM